ncbi:MAG: AraC family ligand binding domain-containing protein, partial [Clostridiales bacterium]|nr:AraC family ligand binding domain-containing protein [Clostridiales bacterium]
MMNATFLSYEDVFDGRNMLQKLNPEFSGFTRKHYHDYYEVQFYTSDGAELFVRNKSYPLHRGDVVLLNIFEQHEVKLNKLTFKERYCIALDPSFVLSVCDEESYILNIFEKSNKNYPVFHMENDDFSICMELLKRYREINLRYGGHILERALLQEILALLY